MTPAALDALTRFMAELLYERYEAEHPPEPVTVAEPREDVQNHEA